MHLAHYIALLRAAELNLAGAFHEMREGHPEEADVYHLSGQLAEQCDDHAARLEPFEVRYADEAPDPPDRLHNELFGGTRSGGLGLLRDLHDLYLMVSECDLVWTLVAQGAQGARDSELLDLAGGCEQETATQLLWLRTRMKQAAPQALVVSS